MPITPTGAPAWVRTNDFATYGGHVDKANYQSQGVVNPRTDVGAAAFSRLVADLEAVTRTASFATVTLTCNDTVPAAPTIHYVNQMTGTTASYAGDNAPAGFPAGARNGDGDVTLTWDANYLDPYSVSGDVDIRHAVATLHGTGSGQTTVELLDPDVNAKNEAVRVRAFAAGSALQDAKVTVEVVTGAGA